MGQRGCEYYEKHYDRIRLLEKQDTWMRETVEEGMCES